MASEDEKLVMFMEITGCSDISTAREYLEFGGGNLETSISLFMESGQNANAASNFIPDDDVQIISETRAPIAPQRETLSGRSYHAPVNHYDIPSSHHFNPNSIGHQTGPSRATNVWEKNDRLAALFEPPHDILFIGSFDMAKKKAQKKDKFVLCNIQESTDFQCQVLNRDVWKNDEVKGIVKKNFIFVQYELNSEEGRSHQTFYPFHGFPYIAIMDSLTGERLKFWNKLITPEEFIFEVLEFLETPHPHATSPVEPVMSKSKSVEMLSEEEQLELAIAASMNGTTVEKVLSEKVQVQETPTDPKSRFKSIQPLNTPDSTGSASETTRVQIRFPDGKRAVRKCLKTSLVRELFAYVKGAFPEISKESFDLINLRESLLAKLDLTISEAGVEGCSLTLDYI